MNISEISKTNIAQIKEALKNKKITTVQLVESVFEAIDKTSQLNAFITLAKESALAQAQAADIKLASNQDSPLLGVPVAIKDMIVTKDIKTTAASKILENYIPPYDATVINKLKDAGAVIVGKTNLDEFAMGSSNETSFFGGVKNPWDLKRVPGGSSGGSAAAVAAKVVPAALGTDTGGSIRQPASLCGVVGVKPTYGRVSRYGAIAYASSLDQIGVFGSCVDDAARMLSVISGLDKQDSTSIDRPVPDFSTLLNRDLKGLRVGVPKEYFISGIQKDTEKAVKKSIEILESKGVKIVEISLPHTKYALSCYYIIAPAEAASNLSRYDGIRYGYRASQVKDLKDLYSTTRSQGFGEEVKRRILLGTHVLSTGYYDAYYVKAQKVRALIAKDFSEAFSKECDLVACPASPSTAFTIGEKSDNPLEMYLSDVFTIPVNLAGLPGLSVPVGYDDKGLPIGLQLIGQAFDEAEILNVAKVVEDEVSKDENFIKHLPQLYAAT
jgi:aspartyl-tRNA(Asn)/glutamyl-tRNA(Gln) amidotransferase subunit A